MKTHRSSSLPPRGSGEDEMPEQKDMQFGCQFGLTENMKKEKHMRDWSTHVRLSSAQLEVSRAVSMTLVARGRM